METAAVAKETGGEEQGCSEDLGQSVCHQMEQERSPERPETIVGQPLPICPSWKTHSVERVCPDSVVCPDRVS